jgi:hypothetical protein
VKRRKRGVRLAESVSSEIFKAAFELPGIWRIRWYLDLLFLYIYRSFYAVGKRSMDFFDECYIEKSIFARRDSMSYARH